MTDRRDEANDEELAASLRVVRLGHGANCSSIGSVLDTLFLGAAAGGALLAAVCAALKEEDVTVAGRGAEPTTAREAEEPGRDEP